MELTVQGLLKINLLKDASIIAGAGGIGKSVCGITIMEAPDIAQWVKGEELILTSLYTLNAFDEGTQRDIINGLYEKNVSAIGFKIRKEGEKISDILIELGNKYEIPIILLPTEVPFIDIMNPVMTEIFNSQMIKLKYYKEVHNKFTKLALDNKNISEIISVLSELVKNPVAVYDKKFNCIDTTKEEITNFDILQETYGIYKESSEDTNYSRQKVIYRNIENKESSQIIVPIETINNIKTYLVVSEVNKELQELDFIAIESAATVICLELVKQFSLSEVEKKYESDLVDDLVSGKNEKIEDLYHRANLIGLDVNHKYLICVFDIESKINNLKVQSALYEIINKYISKGVIRSRSDSITLLWDIEEYIIKGKYDIETIKSILVSIQHEIRSEAITIGISNKIDSLKGVTKGYKEAKEALDLGSLMYNKSSITTFEELGILRLLCKFGDKVELERFIPEEVNKLLEYDKGNSNELLATLEMFLKCGLNASKTAKYMYIHYKTVIYRLDRIKDLTGIDFKDNEKLLEIQVGLKIVQVIKNIKNN